MARKKGSGKAKSTGRKITPDNKQTEKKTDVKVKDDPGGGGAGGGGAKPAMEVTNHRHESRPSQLRQLANGGGGNEGEQTKLTSTETMRSSGSTANNATARNTSPATINSTTTTTVEHYKSCSSSIPSVPAPPTASSVSASSNLKYLHKKFKRIASATLMEEDDAPNLKERERERESTTTVREPVTGNSSLSLQSHQHQQQQLVTVVRPSATVAPLVSHTITSSSSASRPSVSSVGHHASTGDGSIARDDPTGDESTKIVAVRTPSSALLSDNTLAAPADRGAPVAAAAAVIGTSAVVFDYRQQQQQQQQLQQQYHQLHPSLHPGVATVAAFHPQPLLQHHHPHPHPHSHLLFHHHHHQHQQGLPPQQQQQTSANIASSSNSSSSSTIISSSISNSNSSNSSVLLLPQSAIAGVSAVTSSSPLSMSLSSAPAAISDNCDLSVANKLAKSPYSPLGGGAVQYIVAYPQHHQQQQPPPIDQGPKYHSSLHYTNGAVSALVEPRPQPPHRTGGLSSASSGGSSGSPSPPSSVVSNLGTSSGHHTTSSGSASLVASGATTVNTAVVGPGPPGRYVCPYCQMNCSKPSVLEKHIRRHTNERPFKCDLCGIAFKTKSNLYKHRRSRAHASKSQCEDPNGLSLLDDDGGSLGGSDIDDKELSNSGSEIMNYRGSPLDERVNSPQQLLVEKPYKPKFHNAALYTKVENKPIATVGPVGGLGLIGPQQAPNNAPAGSAPVSHYLNGQNVESLEQHISKLISQNEAIVEVVEAPLQKKYHKITGISRGISVSGSGGSSASFSQSTPVVASNSNSNVGAIPSQNSQPLPSVQDAAASRLANALLQQQQQQQQQQQMQSQQMQHLMQLQQHLQPQPYVASYVHLPGQQHVINLTNRPVVTPKSTVILQQQQPQPLASVVVLNGILPTGGNVPGAPNSALESASSSASADRDCQNNVTSDAGSSYQPLNLTKTSAPEQVPVSISERGVAIAPTTQSAFLVQQPLEAGETIQHPMPLYRKQVRKDSQEAQVSTISASPAPQVSTVSVSIATATITTSSTSTTPLSTTVSSSAVTTVSASSASQPPHVPLHIQVSSAGTSSGGVHRPTATPTPPLTVANHPQNPERSIIKDLLLNSRAFGVVQNPDGENGDNLYTCKMCNVSFRDVDSLKYHMICYCQGSGSNLNSPSSSSAPISPVGSPSAAAASYIRSRSVSSLKQLARSSLNPPSARTPSSLSKLAKSQLTRPRTKPENISLPTDSSSSSSVQSSTGSNAGSSFGSKGGLVVDMVQNPLPSPGPLLGNTRLVDSHRPDPGKTQQKNTASDSNETLSKSASHRQHRTLSGASSSSGGHNALHLFGGELEVIERKSAFEDDGDKLTINPSLAVHRYTSGGTFTQNISGMEIEDEETQKRALHYRRTLNSGGTLMEMARTEPSGRGAPLPIVTPKVTASPTHFQFPPINSITAFNSLTLPAVPPPGQASQIVHGGKIIPFVQGMPGPNTLSSLGPAVELVPSAMERRPDPNPQSLLTIVVPSGTGNNPSLAPTHQVAGSLLAIQQPTASTPASSRIGGPAGTSLTYAHIVEAPKKQLAGIPKNGLSVREIWSPAKQQQQQQLQADFSSPSPTQAVSRKSFNFTRMADNVSPRRKADIPSLHLSVADSKAKPDEVRYFNFETMISTSEIMIKPPPPPPPPPAPSSSATTALSVDTSSGAVGSQQESIQNAPVPPSPRPNKFLRPNTLPLKPGTFTPKRHHGITPTNNTMPLISPETPRPSKSCRELYFNGHAYTNIGLKSSTKPFYCTVNKTQPFYFQTQKQLSMYSNWQVHPENDPHPLGLRQVILMALYDSNQHRDRRYAIAGPRKNPLAIVASRPTGGDVVSCLSGEGQVRVSPIEVKSNVPCSPAYVLATLASQQPPTITTMTSSLLPTHYSRESLSPGQQYSEKSKSSTDQALAGSEPSLMMGTSVGGGGSRHPSRSASAERALSGGFESTEEYTYVRGRGRGKYVCNECGIRCKKPSMLKKHIRTHTDVRPYSCQYCSFHFKTKGNLTKHMKSKSHFKKCTELGLNPVPVHVDDDGGDIDIEGDQQSVSSERTSTIPGDSDTATDTDGDETDDSEEMKSRLPEHEAAEGLLSLSMTRPTSACSSLGTGHQPSVGSSMEPTATAEEAYMKQHISSYLTPEQQQSHGLLNSTSSPNPPHSPMTIVQLQQEQDPTVKLDGGSLTHPRRIITYGNGPKLEYNLLKHEQYYSDPNLGSKKKREHERSFPNASDEAARAGDADDEDDTARPIDLTKKPRHQPSARGGETVAEVSLPLKSSTHQYNDRRGMSFHQLQQASASAPQQPLAMVTPHQSSQQGPVEHNHPMIRPLDREQLALHQQMYENRPPSKQPDQQQPQQVIVRVSDVLTPISGTANLLTTLVSNTDKIPLIVTPFEASGGTTPGGVDENSYFHEYLKERALQDTRIKQSQMKPGSSIVMRDAPSPHQHVHPQPQHAQFPQDQIMYNFQQQHVPLQPCYEDAHAPVNVGPSTVAVVAQAPLATKATPPPAALPPLTATVIPPASAATAPTTSTAPPERVYRIFSGKNERHRASPTTEATVKSVPVSHTESPTLPEVKHSGEALRSKYVAVEADGKHNASSVSGSTTVPPSVVTTSNNTLQLVSSASLRVLGNECPLVSENASPMDTLAEIAAGSVKLDVSKVQQQLSFVSEPLPMMPTPTPVTTNVRSRCNSINSNAKVAPPPVPESAKNLASEYLKLAQSVTSKRKRADSESTGGGVSDHETSSLSIPVPVVPVVIAPVAEGVQKPIATVAPIVANIAPLPSTQQQQQQQIQPTGTSAGNGNSSTVSGNGSNVQAVEVATGGGIGPARKVVVVGEDGFKKTVGGGRPVASAGGEFVGTPPSAFTPSMHQEDGGRPVCEICNKKFHKLSQLSIHMNIHYMERKYRCEPCGTSFRSQGLYLKHERSATHRNKVSMTTTFGVATDTNPRPFYCRDCEVGFRIHGHLAKHLRSKMHVLKLECLGKLPFGTYTEIERSGTNLTEIDTSDCENSLSSLKRLAVRLNVKDPAKVLPAGGSAAGSSSSSTSSTGSGGAMGAVGGVGGGTSGNETDSCDDNFGLENGEDEFPLGAGGSKGEITPDDVSHSQRAIVNGEKGRDGVSDGALEAVTTCNGGRELRNINNNVKRKIDDMPSVGKGVEEATCSTSGGVLSEAKRPRYSLELLDGAGSSDVPAEGGVSTSG